MNGLNIDQLILSCLILFPIAGAVLIAVLPRGLSRAGALGIAALNFIFSLHLIANWGSNLPVDGYRFALKMDWLPQFGLSYHVGIDGLSLWMVLLTAFITPLVFLVCWNEGKERAKEFFICLLLVESAAIGVFCALDVILFYVFYEMVLIPIYVLMVGWGGAQRSAAAIKFFLFTMAGSVFMWLAMLFLYFQQPVASRSFDINSMVIAAHGVDLSTPVIGLWLFAAFAVAFAIKTPIFPFHSWQPKAYQQAPVAATVMLAAVLSKMGLYGFLRFAIPFFPNAAHVAAPIIIVLGLIGVVYGALIAVRQTDMKRLLAYSSISHLGVIVVGIFAGLLAAEHGALALSGAAFLMLAHGLTTGALFLLVGMLGFRRGTFSLDQFGGLGAPMPRFTVTFWTALFASIGLPGLCGFVGEYMIFQGVMDVNFFYAAIVATTVITAAIYMLKLCRDTLFGEITLPENQNLPDVGKREILALALLLAAIVWLGVAPQFALDKINPDAQKITFMTGGRDAAGETFAQR